MGRPPHKKLRPATGPEQMTHARCEAAALCKFVERGVMSRQDAVKLIAISPHEREVLRNIFPEEAERSARFREEVRLHFERLCRR